MALISDNVIIFNKGQLTRKMKKELYKDRKFHISKLFNKLFRFFKGKRNENR